jgi:hypothetical protein
MSKPLTTDEAKDKIYDLTKRLFQLESDKKAEMKSYGEDDKELKHEIEETYEKQKQKAISDDAAKGRVYEATAKRIEIAKEKKAKAQEYKDEINDVVSEIFAVFAEQNDQNTAGTNP